MNTVMLVSLVLCAAIAIWGVADPDSMTGSAQWLVNYSLTALDWYFLALCTEFPGHHGITWLFQVRRYQARCR